MKRTPRNHLTVAEAAQRLGHRPRWVKERVKRGELEGLRWSPTDMTISIESIVAYEDRVRISMRAEVSALTAPELVAG
ncbi:MAG: hypothetical protein IPK15_27375 [Verrucomicrobia bacterium]|nr:hypothetical protein [Verrucomicrobiota bacterium]